MYYVTDTVLNLDGEFVKAEPFTPSSIHPIGACRYRKAVASNGTLTAIIACPQCGKYSHIGPHHDPRDWAMEWQRQGNAAVVPMVECGHGCGFHANIALMSWHEQKPENERN